MTISSIWRSAGVAALLLLQSARAQADLVITLAPTAAGGTTISLSGSGVVVPGGALDYTLGFLNFSDSPFMDDIVGGGVGSQFHLSGPISLELNGGATTTYTTSLIRFNNDGAGASDIFFTPATTYVAVGDSYVASGTATIYTGLFGANELPYASLVAGTYLSTSGDSASFGSVTLVISAVPEVSPFVFGSAICAAALAWRQWKVRRHEQVTI